MKEKITSPHIYYCIIWLEINWERVTFKRSPEAPDRCLQGGMRDLKFWILHVFLTFNLKLD